ncbi:serine hydrolase family protein [Nonomuraea gerenzanensis]|uniref:hypothetical protein n=1 Tax=Nonomuraea gerenzanensis TaxID=93944 RepID=UPI001CDA04A3|nr:hypothetical protein [Nonomuraea gerenzanensis]UBU08469.1 hypothetical protein LCN96_29180 [Nonomuraea gerenzanensis]
MTVSVEGTVAVGYEPVRAALEASGATEHGSADCCVYAAGECVVDLRAGRRPEDAFALPRDPALRGVPIIASNGYTNARGLARLHAWLPTALSADTLRDLTVARIAGPDVVLSAPAMAIEQHFSRGFEVLQAGSSSAASGHHGLGCAMAFADPAHRLAFGYTTSAAHLGPPGGDARVRKLTRAISACVPRS